jgi:aspartate-semialdehyde dehydrogenase
MIRHLAIVGATGAVGREALAVLEQRRLIPETLSLFSSARSAGQILEFAGRGIEARQPSPGCFRGVDYAIFSAGASVSRELAPQAIESGTVVVDNSSAFRMREDVPLVIPEVNPDALRSHRGLIANPNCSTIVLAVVIWPLHRRNPLRRVVVSTYQAASGAGAAAMQELLDQTRAHLRGEPVVPRVFPHPVAFNLFSHNTPIGHDGYNVEERKMIEETRKIFGAPDLAITATCIRVPVLRAHSESVNLTFERPITPDEVRVILNDAPGVRVVDDVPGGRFPMPIEAGGQDDCLVGRIRRDASQPDGRGIDLFLSGDQLRKGAALNAVQIIELLYRG